MSAFGLEATRAARGLPSPRGLHAELYARAAATGELHLQRCRYCRTWRHPPRRLCGACGSDAWEWRPTSGRGRLWSWTVTHRPFDPAFASHLPYVIAVVELQEGPRVVGNGVDLAPEDLGIGLPVRIGLDRRSDAIALFDVYRDLDAG